MPATGVAVLLFLTTLAFGLAAFAFRSRTISILAVCSLLLLLAYVALLLLVIAGM